MTRVITTILIVSLVVLASGCFKGQPTLAAATFAAFRAGANLPLPPKIAPEPSGPNCGGAAPCASGPIRVMSYNVLCSICVKPEYDSWFERLPWLQNTIARYDADIIAMQEPSSLLSVLAVMHENLAPYGMLYYGVGYMTYPDNTILYRKDRFEVLDSGRFWLGVYPAHFSLPGWHPGMLRYVNWAKMKERNTGFEFLFIGNHFDAPGHNRDQAARIFTQWLAPVAAKMPIITAGDFNSEPSTDSYKTLNGENGSPMKFDNAFDLAKERIIAHNTTPDEDITSRADYLQTEKIIDHIWTAGPVEVTVNKWIEDRYLYGSEKRRASDHFAIIADLELTAR